MKTIPILFAASLVASTSHAAVIVSDDFTYANGALTGNNGGTAGVGDTWSTTWGTVAGYGSTGVASGAVSTSGSAWNYRGLTTDFVGTSVAPLYFSATFTKTGADTNYALWTQISTSGAVNPDGVVFGLNDNQFLVALRGGGVGSSALFGTVTVDTTYTLVGKLEFNTSGLNERVTIWLNPTGVETGGTSAVATGKDVGWTTPSVAQVGSFVLGDTGQIDNLKIGDTWSSVAIPEPSAALLGGLGLLALLRRRR